MFLLYELHEPGILPKNNSVLAKCVFYAKNSAGLILLIGFFIIYFGQLYETLFYATEGFHPGDQSPCCLIYGKAKIVKKNKKRGLCFFAFVYINSHPPHTQSLDNRGKVYLSHE
jgi:hypothetical protein